VGGESESRAKRATRCYPEGATGFCSLLLSASVWWAGASLPPCFLRILQLAAEYERMGGDQFTALLLVLDLLFFSFVRWGSTSATGKVAAAVGTVSFRILSSQARVLSEPWRATQGEEFLLDGEAISQDMAVVSLAVSYLMRGELGSVLSLELTVCLVHLGWPVFGGKRA